MTTWFTSTPTVTNVERLRQQSEKGRAAQEVAIAAQAVRFRDWLLAQCDDTATHSGAYEWVSVWHLGDRFDERHDVGTWNVHNRLVYFDTAQRAVQMLRDEGFTVLSSSPLCRGGVSGVRLTISWYRTEAEKPSAEVV